ncbi:MAG: FecR family protein [bacterium]|nr:FecR family protein [bacterium]
MTYFDRRFTFISFLSLALSLMVLWGCASIPPRHEDFIGTLRVLGKSNVWVNQKKAYKKMKIYSGDSVRTGQDSSAIISFPDGGFIQLDQNTDPEFRKWFEQAKCIIKIFIGYGRVFGETKGGCETIIETDHLSAVPNTTFQIEVTPQHSTVTVIKGKIKIKQREQPEELVVRSSEQVRVSDRVGEVRTLSREELRSIPLWREKYGDGTVRQEPEPNPMGYCCQDGEVFKSKRSACLEGGGQFYISYEEAQKYCQQPSRTGWCCSDGDVFQSTPEKCKHAGGFFSYDEEAVREECESDQMGYCCQDGEIFQAKSSDCLERGGQFYISYEEAQKYCQQPSRTGWCCRDSEVFQSTLKECEQQEGFFSYDERAVRKKCQRSQQPPRTGWCCIDGDVFQSTPEECERRQGFFSYDEEVARKRCEGLNHH